MQPPVLTDIYAARGRGSPTSIRPTPLLRHPLLARGDRPRLWGEAREPQPHERVQGARRPQSGAVAVARRTPARHRHGEHRQSRPVDRAGLPARRRARARCSCPTATIRTRTRPCARLAPTVDEGGRDFDEARERCEQAAADDRRALRALRQRAAADRRRRHLRARDLRSAARRRHDPRADRRRQRRVRQLPRPHGARVARRASSACRRRTPTPSRARGAGTTRVVGDERRHVRRGHGDAGHLRSARSRSSQRELDDIVTLSEEELAEGVRLALRATHNLAEGAGAASSGGGGEAARVSSHGQRVVAVMSGGNLDAAKLRGCSGTAARRRQRARDSDVPSQSRRTRRRTSRAVTLPVLVFCRDGWIAADQRQSRSPGVGAGEARCVRDRTPAAGESAQIRLPREMLEPRVPRDLAERDDDRAGAAAPRLRRRDDPRTRRSPRAAACCPAARSARSRRCRRRAAQPVVDVARRARCWRSRRGGARPSGNRPSRRRHRR